MCGQENKKMSAENLVESLTEKCIELRHKILETDNIKEKNKIVLEHIKEWVDTNTQLDLFQKGLEWFNVEQELTVSQLNEKIVILDFFTYCCINCMHILPDLKALEKTFSIEDGLVVIGVHSAKFSNERNSEKLLSAVERYNISHPVVNDGKHTVWQNLGIVCWPTIVILGPKLKPLFVLVGEGRREELFIYSQVALSYFQSLKQISNHQLPIKPSHHLLPQVQNKLSFPAKIETFLSDDDEEKVVISDSGNNRIVICNIDGVIECIVGGNAPGFKDGNFNEAQFNAPQGIAVLEDEIYVADNENHAIRVINLRKKTVHTVAGNGTQGHDYLGGKKGTTEQLLSSPWDVAIYYHCENEKKIPIVLIAMAGLHQIWALFVEDTLWWKKKEYKAGTCAAIVGSGKEENRNNSYPHAAGLAQPSGLAVVQELKSVFFADSESSSIRRVYLEGGKVAAVAGGDKNPLNLHDFGNVDGVGCSAKLQHPLGVSWDDKDNCLYVADTYNHIIKRIDTSGKCTSVYGAGKPSNDFMFDEPSGLAVSKTTNTLLIADTNNHAIKMINKADKTIKNIHLKENEKENENEDASLEYSLKVNQNESTVKINFTPKLKPGVKLTADAPQKWSIKHLPASWAAEQSTGPISSAISIDLPKDDAVNDNKVVVFLNLIICKDDMCIPKKLKVTFDIKRESNASSKVEISKSIDID